MNEDQDKKGSVDSMVNDSLRQTHEQIVWEEEITEFMITSGWTKDRDNKTTIGFKNGDWIRDYNKKTRRFIHFNGEQKMNLTKRII